MRGEAVDHDPDNAELYIDVMGDIRCVQCLDVASGFEVMVEADKQQLGVLLQAFGRDLTCYCERVRWDVRTATATATASIGCNICGEALPDAEPHICAAS